MNDDTPDPNTTRILSIAKHRNGETGKIVLRWIGKYMKFGNYNKGDDIMDIL
jgi:replicative DNA helicase